MMSAYPIVDEQFEDSEITRVDEGGDGWTIEHKGWSFWVPRANDESVVPVVGARARFYGRGIGSVVRGLFIDGKRVFYRTASEQEAKDKADIEAQNDRDRAKFAENRADHDARIAQLPQVFRDRVEAFQKFSTDWRWQHEGYELYCCEQAVVIVNALGTIDAIREWYKLPWDEQTKRVTGLDDGHSGNTFGMAARLAMLYLDRPELVEQEHGAMCPIVGCREYGCFAARQPLGASR